MHDLGNEVVEQTRTGVGLLAPHKAGLKDVDVFKAKIILRSPLGLDGQRILDRTSEEMIQTQYRWN